MSNDTQALRTVEIMHAKTADRQRRGDDCARVVREKFHDRLLFSAPCVVNALRGYHDCAKTRSTTR